MILRKLTLALSAVALSFSVSAFAQQTAPQPDQQAPTNPAGEVIGNSTEPVSLFRLVQPRPARPSLVISLLSL